MSPELKWRMSKCGDVNSLLWLQRTICATSQTGWGRDNRGKRAFEPKTASRFRPLPLLPTIRSGSEWKYHVTPRVTGTVSNYPFIWLVQCVLEYELVVKVQNCRKSIDEIPQVQNHRINLFVPTLFKWNASVRSFGTSGIDTIRNFQNIFIWFSLITINHYIWLIRIEPPRSLTFSYLL